MMNVNENQIARKNMQKMIHLNKQKNGQMKMHRLQVTLFFNFTTPIAIFCLLAECI